MTGEPLEVCSPASLVTEANDKKVAQTRWKGKVSSDVHIHMHSYTLHRHMHTQRLRHIQISHTQRHIYRYHTQRHTPQLRSGQEELRFEFGDQLFER